MADSNNRNEGLYGGRSLDGDGSTVYYDLKELPEDLPAADGGSGIELQGFEPLPSIHISERRALVDFAVARKGREDFFAELNLQPQSEHSVADLQSALRELSLWLLTADVDEGYPEELDVTTHRVEMTNGATEVCGWSFSFKRSSNVSSPSM